MNEPKIRLSARRPPTAQEIWETVCPEKIWKKRTASCRNLEFRYTKVNLKNLCMLLNSFQITQLKFSLAYPHRKLDSCSWLRAAKHKISNLLKIGGSEGRSPVANLLRLGAEFSTRRPAPTANLREPVAQSRLPDQTAGHRPPISHFWERADFLGFYSYWVKGR